MRCERAQELFSDYYEGAVQTALRVPLESHLDTCPQCRSEVDGLREVWALLDGSPVVEPPADLRAAVWRRIDAAAEQNSHVRRAPFWAFDWRRLYSRPALAWGAAVLLVLLLASYAVPGHYTPAGIGSLWPVGAPQVEAAPPPTIGPAVTGEGPTRQVALRVVNSAPEPLEARVTLLDGPAGYAGGSAEFTVPAHSEALPVLIPAGVNPGPAPLHLRVQWKRGAETGDSTCEVSAR